MKKHVRTLIAVLLVAVMVLGVVGCAGDATPTETSKPDQTTAPDNSGNNSNNSNNGSNNGGNGGGNGDGPTGPIVIDRDHDVALNTEGVTILGFKNATRALDEGIYLDWAGSGVEFNTEFLKADTARIWVTALAEDEEIYCQFNVYVDGELALEKVEVQCAAAEDTFIDVPDIAVGEHVITLVKLTEEADTSALVTKITFSGNLVAEEPANELVVEFIGGADVVGADLGVNDDGDDVDDLTLSFAWAAANALNANYQLTASSAWDVELATLNYTKAAPNRDASISYKFLTDVDVVVIAIDGTADQYAELLEVVRNWNDPQTKIILCALNTDAVAAVNTAVTDALGVYALDVSAVEDVAGAIVTKVNEVKDVVINYPTTPGQGSVQDWEQGV